MERPHFLYPRARPVFTHLFPPAFFSVVVFAPLPVDMHLAKEKDFSELEGRPFRAEFFSGVTGTWAPARTFCLGSLNYPHYRNVACHKRALFWREGGILFELCRAGGTAAPSDQFGPGEADLRSNFARGRSRASVLHGGRGRRDHGPLWVEQDFRVIA